LFYNHYDVQPPEPLELWDSPPFEPTTRDGKIYARGVADDKGHLASRLAAIEAVRKARGELPCRVKFLVEGEEEIGSVHLEEFVDHNRDLLRADAAVWESGSVNDRDQPTLYLGMRGICYVELRVRTIAYDAHSGQGGSILPNAAWRLSWALSTLKTPDERIRVPGFYDAVEPPSARDLDLLARLPDDEAELRQRFGVERFLNGATGVDLKRQAVFDPTCTICGLTAGYQGPGTKTVLPAEASAKVDFRLVPRQDPRDIYNKVCRHLQESGFGDVEVTLLSAEHPARIDPDDPFVRLDAWIAEEVYGTPPAIAPLLGGSGPMYPFVEYLGLPIATPGIGYPEARVHAPNENVRIADFVRGTRHMAHLLDQFSSM
jgi:acetylornithine deacetylase/succinyl-diaminopimelate desuccinylase-like protein